jgi:pseudaminic acid synthase
MNIDFGKKKIGKNFSSLIVAEMSGNHGGSLKRAIEIIKAAKKSGADAIKLQTYTSDTITLNSNKKDFKISKKSPWYKKKNLWNLYNYAHTPWKWHERLFSEAKKIGIEIFSSPFDETAVDFLEKLNCCAYKIASSEINHIPLLKKVSLTNKPIILSTGLANIKDLDFAVKFLKKEKVKKIIILLCVSDYPADIRSYSLNNLILFKKKYNVEVGLSDHTMGNELSIASIVLGAKFIEKHFNLNGKTKTVDSFFSSNENDFKNYVKGIRNIEESLKIKKNKLYQRNKNSTLMRSIYVSNKILKGDKITKRNIKIVRPGHGLHPKYYNKILGLKVNKNIDFGERLNFKFIKGFKI